MQSEHGRVTAPLGDQANQSRSLAGEWERRPQLRGQQVLADRKGKSASGVSLPDSAWEQGKQSSPYSFLKKEKRNSPNSTIHFIVEESVLYGRLYFLPEMWNQEESNSISFSLDPYFLNFYTILKITFHLQLL